MKGVILAAGEGSRMSSVTYDAYPKELLPIGNIPTIRFVLETLKLADVKKILVVIDGKTKNGIVAGLGSGKKFGLDISYVVQERDEVVTGLGAAIYSVKEWIDENEDILVACGDTIICDFSKPNPLSCLIPLVKIHKFTDSIATTLVYPTKLNPTRYGVVKFNKIISYDKIVFGSLNDLVEKPSLDVAQNFRANGYNYILTGYYVFRPKIFSYIERTNPDANEEVQITDSMKLALEDGNRICGVVHGNGKKDDIVPCHYWDTGIPEDYKEANKYILDLDPEKIFR